MLIEFFTVFIYSVFSFLFIKYWNFDVYWIWTIEYIYFGVLGLLSILYLRYYPWKNKIV
jgi:multidrug resistance protein, MATE family